MELLKKNLKITTSNGKKGLIIEQKQSRLLKKEITQKVSDSIEQIFSGVETIPSREGTIILIENEFEGVIPCVLDIKIKPLDYDYLTLEQDYKIYLQELEAKQSKG